MRPDFLCQVKNWVDSVAMVPTMRHFFSVLRCLKSLQAPASALITCSFYLSLILFREVLSVVSGHAAASDFGSLMLHSPSLEMATRKAS